MPDEIPQFKKTEKPKRYTGLIGRVVIILVLGYLAYVFYIKNYLDGILKY